MPARRKTKADRVRETFSELYRVGKARANVTEEDLATMLGFKTRRPLLVRREDPTCFTLGQIVTMATLFRWTEDEWQRLIDIIGVGKR